MRHSALREQLRNDAGAEPPRGSCWSQSPEPARQSQSAWQNRRRLRCSDGRSVGARQVTLVRRRCEATSILLSTGSQFKSEGGGHSTLVHIGVEGWAGARSCLVNANPLGTLRNRICSCRPATRRSRSAQSGRSLRWRGSVSRCPRALRDTATPSSPGPSSPSLFLSRQTVSPTEYAPTRPALRV